jgi:hypothetical protein
MLTIEIPDKEVYDEKENVFFIVKGRTIVLEHSLVSLAKWESKWGKPFLTREGHSRAETIDYIRFMTITQNIPPEVFQNINSDLIGKINAYIEDPMTATTFSSKEKQKGINRDIITAEIIYYWMIALNIPFECQKWHLNRLLTLINVCNIKNQPSKKMTRQEVLARNRALNAQRRAQLNTRG